MSVLLPIAYAPSLAYMALLYAEEGRPILLEAHEHIVKQSWRNRCDILTAQGVQSLTIPIERPEGWRTSIKDVRISEHGAWRHQHEQALRTNYGSSPYFEYYWDDIQPFYEKRYDYLWDYNLALLTTLCRLIDLDLCWEETSTYVADYEAEVSDWRSLLHPRRLDRSRLGDYPPYYQALAREGAFTPELSCLDLLMNKGPESLLYLRDYARDMEIINPFRCDE